MAKFVSPWVPSPLAGRRYQNNADAIADIIATLAGNAALLNGFVEGGAEIDTDVPNLSPYSPGGVGRGHDHSGGVYGRPFYRTLASWNWRRGIIFERFDQVADTTAFTTSNPFPVWIPHCDKGPTGAYNNVAFRMRLDIDTSTNVDASDSVAMRLYNRHPSLNPTDALFDVTIPSATSTGERYVQALGSVPVVSGAVNPMVLALRLATASTPAPVRSLLIFVHDLEIGVVSSVT